MLGHLFVAAALLVGPSASQRQFNLICLGQSYVQLSGPGGGQQDYSNTIHVDLDAMIWCGGSCKSPQRINKVEDNFLELTNTHDATSGFRMVIDRRSGSLSAVMQGTKAGAEITMATTAVCKTAPFTPMGSSF